MDKFYLIAVGLITLIAGAELVIRGATKLALSLGVKPLILGITIVAIGTSAPELAVGITAGLHGSGALAVGNIAGTNVFNIMFILGMSAMVKPLPLHSQILKLELPVTLISSLIMIICALDGNLSRFDGFIMCLGGVIYTTILICISRKESKETVQDFEEVFDVKAILRWNRLVKTRPGYCLILTVGITLSILGADWLVDGSVALAQSLGVSDAIIGLTVIAVGTSAPELITTILSTIKGDRDVAVGNLLGSSIYNILFILGISCIVAPNGFPVEKDLLLVDIPLVVAVSFACIPVFLTGGKISRLEGTLSVVGYIAYMTWMIFIRM